MKGQFRLRASFQTRFFISVTVVLFIEFVKKSNFHEKIIQKIWKNFRKISDNKVSMNASVVYPTILKLIPSSILDHRNLLSAR